MYHSQQQQHDQQQQQQQQAFFYQPPQGGNSYFDPTTISPPPFADAVAFNDANTRFRGENPHHGGNSHHPYKSNPRQTRHPHHPGNHEFSPSVQTPTSSLMGVALHSAESFSSNSANTAALPRPFGGGEASGPNNMDGSLYRTTPLPPPPQRSFQPFVQSPSSAGVVPMPVPSFHERSVTPKAPFQQQPQQPPQQPFHQTYATQEQPHMGPVRTGIFARLLSAVVSQEAIGGESASSSAAPPHQTRFGFEEDDLPLLEELGIFPARIRTRALSGMNPFSAVSRDIMEDMDLAGPIVFAIALAILLTLRGKVQFSAVYGHSVIGVVFTKVLLSLMADCGVPLQLVISSLGYSLIPNVLLAAFHLVLYWFFGYVGRTMIPFAFVIVAWSAWCATSMLVDGLMMENQRYLIMYPIFLFYAVFAMLTIF